MKKIILFDTSMGSLNLGDFIIMEAINKQMKKILDKNFIVNLPTHTPIMHSYQMLRNNVIKNACETADYKFICGTNLLTKNLKHITLGWNINSIDAKNYKGAICIGCGMNSEEPKKVNNYTKKIYKRVLNPDFIHSVRDDRTKKFLESMGFKAINTGCSTLWGLNKEFCKEIETNKSENVVFTLTDYEKDEEYDQKLIDILVENYKNVYFWPQGLQDYEYIMKMKNIEKITILEPSLVAYREILDKENIEYVGTRLHAGIYAMQHKKRSIIIKIDNRSRDMAETYGLNCVERKEIDKITNMINSKFETRININEENIKLWKNQFEEERNND